MRGGEDHVGWDQTTYLLADIFDALNQNTRASGNFKKPPKIPPYPRPKKPYRPTGPAQGGLKKKSKVTVAQLWGQMSSAAAKDHTAKSL